MPEFRAHITVAGLPIRDTARWEPFRDALEREHANLGPILSWRTGVLVVALAADCDDQAEAAAVMIAAVTDSLRAAGLGALYPAVIELEPVD